MHFADNFNRVVLKTLSGVEHSDYINASYVDVRVQMHGQGIQDFFARSLQYS